jgi:hypothetical protein
MSSLKKSLLALLALLCLPWAVQAHGGLAIGINFGVPCYYRQYWGGYYYYRPYAVYVDAPPVVLQPAPVVAQSPTAPAPAPATASAPAPEQLRPVPTPTPTAAPAATTAGGEPRDQIDQYLRQMSSADEHIRAGAMVQLGRIKAQRAVEPISQALANDPSPAAREAAARALGLIGSSASLAALQRAAQADDDREVRHSAQFAAEVIRANLPR